LTFLPAGSSAWACIFFFGVTSEDEKVIITDSLIAHEPHIHGDDEIPYLPPSTLPENRRAVIQKFSMRQQRLPSEVMLRDDHYRHPGLELGAWTSTKTEGGGRIYSYGEHFQTPEEGLFLARIRAQEINCRQKIFNGEGTAPFLRPGFTFKPARHFRDSFNGEYLTTGIRHEWAQTLAFVSGVKQELTDEEHQSIYLNSFSAIPRDVQYRPPREHPRPRFYGTPNAHIDAAGSGQYAEVDLKIYAKLVGCWLIESSALKEPTHHTGNIDSPIHQIPPQHPQPSNCFDPRLPSSPFLPESCRCRKATSKPLDCQPLFLRTRVRLSCSLNYFFKG
jgi:hypothetical protein